MKWQPIETAPKDATNVLLCDDDIIFIGFWSKGETVWTDGSTDMFDQSCAFHPTHWMPLPTPPEGGQ